jgi:hypothetical protein
VERGGDARPESTAAHGGRKRKEQWPVRQRWHADLQLAVKSGFLYVPLLLDPDIARALEERCGGAGRRDARPAGGPKGEGSGVVLDLEGKHFVQSVSVDSVLANYETTHRDSYEEVKRRCLPKSLECGGLEGMGRNGKLEVIVFKIMPHFIRKSKGLERKALTDEDLIELIGSKVAIPGRCMAQAGELLDSGPVLRRLKELEQRSRAMEPLQEGLVDGTAFHQWLLKALEVQIVHREIARLEHELHERERLGESQRKRTAMLVHFAEGGTFELDGFGFSRIGSRDEYLIYKRTGEYILKDYYGRSYLFPDCRVGVSTAQSLRPLVIDHYKHPFLFGHAAKQEICLSNQSFSEEFTPGNVIRILEEGINALLYGYDARRRNGYHSLDPTLYHVKTVEFRDYRI